jgi:hypothetical protein
MAVQLDGYFFQRCERQQLEMTGEGPYDAQVVIGDYSAAEVCPAAGPKGTVEVFAVRTIDRALEQRRRSGQPVAALDSGGGLGLSWLRLAKRYQQEVHDGRLLLAVTSVQGMPELFLKMAATAVQELGDLRDLTRAQVDEAMRLMEAHGDSVQHYAVNPRAPARHFSTVPVDDFVLTHERRGGVVWSRTPESHVLRMGNMTAPDGYLMIDGADLGEAFGAMPLRERTARLNGVTAAVGTLMAEQHMQLVLDAQLGAYAGAPLEYAILAGPRAEPVAFG